MIPRSRSLVAVFGAVALACIVVACSRRPELVPIPPTDTSNLEVAVRNAIAVAQAQFDSTQARIPPNADLAEAYGQLALVYHAQDLATPAEAAYRNAHALAPRDKRWAYLLAHLYADSSRVPEAIRMFEVVREIDDNDLPTQLALAQLYLSTGEYDKSAVLFQKALTVPEARAAALAGLGRLALAQGDYKEAVDKLEEALKLVPAASRLRQPLAMAYRGLGDTTRAEANLAHYVASGDEPGVPDPIVDQLSAKVVVSKVLLRRGQRLGKEGRFDLAEQAFRTAVTSDPTNAEAIANLGISLANLGRTAEARARLQESLRLDDTNGPVHFNLAVVYDREGLDSQAAAEYEAALRYDASNAQARTYLADLKMRIGQAEEAAALYREALRQVPDSSRLQLSLALALIRAERIGEARQVLEGAVAAQPQNADLVNMLARVLVTAKDPKVRDGKRALAMAKALFEATRSLAVGQTYAMAFAETGNFAEAVKLQQETIIGYERSGTPVDKSFLERNRALYQRHEPARQGWSIDDPVFQPRSPAARPVTPSPSS
jgi:tetratricopeptide (TPR) repeat protein